MIIAVNQTSWGGNWIPLSVSGTWNPGSTNLCHPETGDYHSPTLLCQSLPIFADLCMTDQMQIWKWTSTPASVLLCIVRSTYAAVSRPTISSSSVSSLREMAEKYSIIWASVICGAHNFLCLLPLWDRALQRWRMSSWYFSATLTMGTMTMLVTAPQLHRQWGHCGTILGYHSKFSGSQDCHLRLHQSWWLPLFIKQGVPK